MEELTAILHSVQRDSFAKNLESAWQPVMLLLLGGGMLILHHAVLGAGQYLQYSVTVSQCHSVTVSQCHSVTVSYTPLPSLDFLMTIDSVISTLHTRDQTIWWQKFLFLKWQY